MDLSERMITKIAREAGRFTLKKMKAEGIGSGEFDFIHLVRHHPGITQAEIRETLKMDKGAAARRAARLEAKGYLVKKEHPSDRRCQCLFATEKAERLRNSKASLETSFYEWLLTGLPKKDAEEFCRVLTILYERSKQESRAGFPDIVPDGGQQDERRQDGDA